MERQGEERREEREFHNNNVPLWAEIKNRWRIKDRWRTNKTPNRPYISGESGAYRLAEWWLILGPLVNITCSNELSWFQYIR